MALELKHLTTQMHEMATKGIEVAGAAIDEISRLRAENAELKQKLEDAKATAYAESVDAGMRERRLKLALWLSRADRAMMTLDYFTLKCRWFKDYMKVEPPKCDVKMIHKWATVQRKCRAKMEEYK